MIPSSPATNILLKVQMSAIHSVSSKDEDKLCDTSDKLSQTSSFMTLSVDVLKKPSLAGK